MGLRTVFFSACTCLILPARNSGKQTLTVVVMRDGEELDRSQYEARVVSWLHFSLVFATANHRPDEVLSDMLDGLLLRSLNDIQQKGLLNPSEETADAGATT